MNYYRNFMRNDFRHRSKADKKNILMVTAFMPYPLNKGGNIRIHTLAKLLNEKYNCYLLTLIHKENEIENVPNIKDVFKEIYTVYHKSAIPRWSMIPTRYKFSYSIQLIEKLKEIQKNLALDLVHIESNELLYLIKEIRHAPIIYTEHDISILNFANSFYKKQRLILTDFFDYLKIVFFHSQSYKCLNRAITLSLEDGSILKRWFPDANITYIPTGVDVP
jgi:glycosyltransferase involved in cell wall biosynthesis